MNKFTKYSFFTIVILLIVAFISGILIGMATTDLSVREINKMILDSELNTESYLLEQKMFSGEEGNCEIMKKRFDDLSYQLWILGKELNKENIEQELQGQYDYLKRKFHLMQIRTYLLMKKLQGCGDTKSVILYYFSRNEESKKQGEILDKVVEDHDIYVFAIELNYSSEFIFLEKSYGITKSPALVINYEKIIQGSVGYDTIITEINQTKKI